MEFSPLREHEEEPSCSRACHSYWCVERGEDGVTRLCCLLRRTGISAGVLLSLVAGLGLLYGLGLLSEYGLNDFSGADMYYSPEIALFCLLMTLPVYAGIAAGVVALFFTVRCLVGYSVECCTCDGWRRRYTRQYASIDA
jgi:hypothetical protein